MTITSLSDKDRIFTNLYGFQGADLKAAQARGDWDGTAALMKVGEDAIIEVIDNGCGISKENLTRIFNLGFTTKRDGHGYGLHSSALAAGELGGALGVKSEGVGQGATFALRLPCRPAVKAA